ncbi:Meiotic recombination protein SPO11 [Smittium mucronatum]|uniref:DNA topoisomerase (ATP-hydrolyzing) n=1 Tax=Smittium mucronatum TaxID=133383 RepID=A0A1R0H691_9FUNG|nr:Meiotic recombination protein SPO11 [Smittium mucronatum]
MDDLEGPLIFVIPGEENGNEALCVLTNKGGYTETGQITRETQYLGLSPISVEHTADSKQYEPKGVEQVFVGQKLSSLNNNETRMSNRLDLAIDGGEGKSQAENDYFAFKTYRGGYLSFSLKGEVSVETVAIGPAETWEPVLRINEEGPGSVSLMGRLDKAGLLRGPNTIDPDREVSGFEGADIGFSLPSNNRFLSFTPLNKTLGVSGSNKQHVHCNSCSIGFGEVFKAYCQAKVKYSRMRARLPKTDDTSVGSLANDELETTFIHVGKNSKAGDMGRTRFQACPRRSSKRPNWRGKFDTTKLIQCNQYQSDYEQINVCVKSEIDTPHAKFSQCQYSLDGLSELDFDSNITLLDSNFVDPIYLKSNLDTEEDILVQNLNSDDILFTTLESESSLGTNFFNSESDVDGSKKSTSDDIYFDFFNSSQDEQIFKLDSYSDEYLLSPSSTSIHSFSSENSFDSLLLNDKSEQDGCSLGGPSSIFSETRKSNRTANSNSMAVLNNIFFSESNKTPNSRNPSENTSSDQYLLDTINFISIQIGIGKIKPFQLPEIINSNQIYSIHGHNKSKRRKSKKTSTIISESKRGIQYLLILKAIKGLVIDKKFTRRRDIYYKNMVKFTSQRQVDRMCNKLESFFQVSPFEMRIMASPTGLIYGPIQIQTTHGKTIDCRLDAFQGLLIPDANSISSICPINGLKYVLIVEKETIFLNLLQTLSTASQNFLLITGKGYPSHNTRDFLSVLKTFLRFSNVQWFVLTDNDPHGAHIFQIYYESNLARSKICQNANPRFVWLGLHSRDRSR